MEAQRTAYGWVLRLDRGEEIVASIESFALHQGIRAAAIAGLGSLGECELGFFRPLERRYDRRVFAGDHEIGSLTGNVSDLQGIPFAHCHVVIGDSDMTAHTGHLFRGVVSVTCELQLFTDPGVLVRASRPDLGFNPLDPR